MRFVDVDYLWRFAGLLCALGAGYFFSDGLANECPFVVCEVCLRHR